MGIALKRLPDARCDIAEAMRWYEDQKPGLGYRFLKEVDEAVNSPREKAFQQSKRFENARRLNLPNFLYAVWYEVKENSVEVFAILHHARNPRLARERYQSDR
jgi:plasmid stabilization system protein ParE